MFGNRLPVGPGSRGGSWHDPEYRRMYHRAWRLAHPDYRERERLRRWRSRNPADIGTGPAPKSLPLAVARCACACRCDEVVVNVCGWCRDGGHR